MVADREKTIRLLREAILQLCRVSLMGSFEVDGIICISPGNSEDEHQLVVKVHEQVSDELITRSRDLKEKRLRNVQPNKTLTFNEDSVETTNETVSTLKTSGSEANSWTSDITGCITGSNSWKQQVNTALKAPISKRRLAPSQNFEEIQELSVKKTVRKIEDSFYFSCRWCSIAFTSKLALDNHLEQCGQRSSRFVCVDPRVTDKGNCDNFQRKASRKRKQHKPLKGLDTATTTNQPKNLNESIKHGTNLDAFGADQFLSDQDQLLPAEGDPDNNFENHTYNMVQERMPEAAENSPQDLLAAVKAEPLYSCQECKTEFPDFTPYDVHCRTLHGRHPCAYCHETFAEKKDFDQHIVVHSNRGSYDCLLCGLVLTSRSTLRAHHVQVHGLMADGTSLEDGSSLLENPSFDVKVEQLQDSIEELVRDCADPGEADASMKGFQDPVVIKFSNSDGIPQQTEASCQDPVFSNFRARQVLSSVPCASRLQRSFERKDRTMFGEDEKVYECDKCREFIRGTSIYQTHCKKLHRRTPCLHCGKTFSQKGNMERHMRLHMGVKPYRCHLCRRSFSRKEALLGHVNQDHSAALQNKL